jgi:FkbM family methyltransferase
VSRFDRFVGVARSLAIYHGIAGRQRHLRTLYGQFVKSGDLVFDIGAHAGNRTRAFAALGCRVVSVEPQPDFARVLRTLFGRNPKVTVLEMAVSDTPGRATLSLSERTPTVTTLAEEWREARAQEPGFKGVDWNRQIDVETTTLDALIERFGSPSFVKMDVEGSEPAILGGLTHAVQTVSFEYLPWTLAESAACIARLEQLGRYEFNWSIGEGFELASKRWMDADGVLAALRTPAGQERAGDVYARGRTG